MDMLSTHCWTRVKPSNLYLVSAFQFLGRDRGLCSSKVSLKFSTRLCRRCEGNINALASKNQTKKSRRKGKAQKEDSNLLPIEQTQNENDGVNQSFSENAYIHDKSNYEISSDNIEIQTSTIFPSRNAVLQACTVTSGLIGALGFLIRQVLTSLEPLDYLVVAFLPGISEELLFRGALLPLFGLNWTSILAVAVLFGILHLGGGRKYSFAIWATLVGILYGYTTNFTSSVTVPMASHALNNLVGGIIWRYQRRLDSL